MARRSSLGASLYWMGCRAAGTGGCASWPPAWKEAGALRANQPEDAADAGTAAAKRSTAAIAIGRTLAINDFTNKVEMRRPGRGLSACLRLWAIPRDYRAGCAGRGSDEDGTMSLMRK